MSSLLVESGERMTVMRGYLTKVLTLMNGIGAVLSWEMDGEGIRKGELPLGMLLILVLLCGGGLWCV